MVRARHGAVALCILVVTRRTVWNRDVEPFPRSKQVVIDHGTVVRGGGKYDSGSFSRVESELAVLKA